MVSARTLLSAEATFWKRGGTSTAMTSSANLPLAQASAALRWLSSAKRSCASREMPFSQAIFWALSPMVSPVVGSLSAGGTGAMSLSDRPAKARTLSGTLRAREAFTSAWASLWEAKMGASERDSAPPAMTVSAWPSRIWSAASVAAWREVAQARDVVWAGSVRGSSVRSTTSRPMSEESWDGITWPKMSASNSERERPLRATSSFTRIAPRSTAERSLKSPPDRTKGVRSPATTATRGGVAPSELLRVWWCLCFR